MAGELVIVGGGGHALVVAEAALAAGFELAGCIDDDPYPALNAGAPSAPRLGSMERLAELLDGRRWILGLGDLGVRDMVLRRLTTGAAAVVHPRAAVSASARVGDGAFVGPGAVVNTRARLGEHAIINSGAIVEHECMIGRNAHIAPGAALAGRVKVGEGSLVGLGARVLPNLTIGAGCVIGAGAVVVRHVEDGATVAGVPASARR